MPRRTLVATTHQAHDLLAKGFGAGSTDPSPSLAEMGGSDPTTALQHLVDSVRSSADVVTMTPPHLPGLATSGSSIATFNVSPGLAPQDAATTNLVTNLRTT
jgi:hypothetical protein